jgi:hypothetical protein
VRTRLFLKQSSRAVHLGYLLFEGGQGCLQLGELRVKLVVPDEPGVWSVARQQVDVL